MEKTAKTTVANIVLIDTCATGLTATVARVYLGLKVRDAT